jgi:hypothetical protein
MRRSYTKTREEARRLYLTSELTSNAEIAARLDVKPHTVGKWRRDERWDDLRLKIDRRAAEMFVEKIATDRVTLNVRHFRYWEALVVRLVEVMKGDATLTVQDLDRIAGILSRAQKGQRLAKGLSVSGETEEAIRAQSETEIRRLIDAFTEVVKEHVPDEEAREQIRQALHEAILEEADAGTGEPGDQVA